MLEALDSGRLRIGEGTLLEPGCWLTLGPEAEIRIGEGCFLNRETMLRRDERIEIGDHVMFANGCFVGDAAHRYDDPEQPVTRQGFEPGRPVRIGSNVWFGVNCVVTGGVEIGDRAVIGANSVVTGDVPAGDDRRRRPGEGDQGDRVQAGGTRDRREPMRGSGSPPRSIAARRSAAAAMTSPTARDADADRADHDRAGDDSHRGAASRSRTETSRRRTRRGRPAGRSRPPASAEDAIRAVLTSVGDAEQACDALVTEDFVATPTAARELRRRAPPERAGRVGADQRRGRSGATPWSRAAAPTTASRSRSSWSATDGIWRVDSLVADVPAGP